MEKVNPFSRLCFMKLTLLEMQVIYVHQSTIRRQCCMHYNYFGINTLSQPWENKSTAMLEAL